MEPLILIPCKSFAAGKSRLRTVLSPEGCDALCRSFLIQTVNLAAKLVTRGHIHVVSSDRNVAGVASDLGVNCDGENDVDLNSALTGSVAKILAREHQQSERNILILPIDLALNSPAAVTPIIAAQAEVVVVPDRLEQGTNLLRLRGDIASNFRFQYGDHSFPRHLAEAERLGLIVEVMRDSLLSFDVDTPADYAVWVSQAGTARACPSVH